MYASVPVHVNSEQIVRPSFFLTFACRDRFWYTQGKEREERDRGGKGPDK